MCKQQLVSQGKEKYSIGQIITENILIVIHIVFGIWAMWDIKFFDTPILSLLYFIFAFFMLLIFLRKHLCTHCYYYGKACHCGWGKVAKLYQIKSGNIKLAKFWAGATWGILMGVPLLIAVLLTVLGFSYIRLTQLLILFVLFIVQSVIHNKDCTTCKMKTTCPGAMGN